MPKPCWDGTLLKEWDLDIYAEYDYTTGEGVKPPTDHLACDSVFRLLDDRLKRANNERNKAPYIAVHKDQAAARVRMVYPQEVTGHRIETYLKSLGVYDHAAFCWPTPPGQNFAKTLTTAPPPICVVLSIISGCCYPQTLYWRMLTCARQIQALRHRPRSSCVCCSAPALSSATWFHHFEGLCAKRHGYSSTYRHVPVR